MRRMSTEDELYAGIPKRGRHYYVVEREIHRKSVEERDERIGVMDTVALARAAVTTLNAVEEVCEENRRLAAEWNQCHQTNRDLTREHLTSRQMRRENRWIAVACVVFVVTWLTLWFHFGG